MSFESKRGQGNRFFLRLPLKAVPAAAPDEPPLLTAKGLPPNLLFVEESVDNCRHLEAMARRLGCTAESVTDCNSALRAIQAALLNSIPFDVVFIDVSLPGVNGAETAARIRDRFENQPAVMMGLSGERACVGAGAAFLQKPVFRSALADCLRETLRNAPPGRPRAIARAGPSFAGKTVLIADDMDVSRDMLAVMLAATGVGIIFAEDGKVALEAFRAAPEKIDLILMDIYMPKMGGTESARHIRALDLPRSASIPIIAVTAEMSPEDIKRNTEAGITDHIAKPLDEAILMEVLQKYLS